MKSKNNITPVILCGGEGARLFPLSMPDFPKPFLTLHGDKTLFEHTLFRAACCLNKVPPMVVCNVRHYRHVKQGLAAMGQEAHIICEPSAKNTAAAMISSALYIEKQGLADFMLVLPSDHFIENEALFAKIISEIPLKGDRLIVFSVPPTRPDTSFGYVEVGDRCVDSTQKVLTFIEKPDAALAAQYIAAENFYWNAGIFLLPTALLLQEARRLVPEIVEACLAALEAATNSAPNALQLDEAAYASISPISIDYAIMEHSPLLYAVPMQCGWNDLGTFESLAFSAAKHPRPWGFYEVLSAQPDYVLKRLTFTPHSATSYQKHAYRSEFLKIISGAALIRKGDQSLRLEAGETLTIEQGEWHQIGNQKDEPLIIMEVQRGSKLDEADIIRA